MPGIWFKSTHNSKNFQNFHSNQLTSQKSVQNLDSNQLMTQWCYSFPVSVDLFWAFNFTVGLVPITFLGFPSSVDFVWPFLGFRLKYIHSDKLIWISSWLKQYLGDLNRFSSWFKRLFQELTQNQLKTQVDSEALIQIRLMTKNASRLFDSNQLMTQAKSICFWVDQWVISIFGGERFDIFL